MPPTTASLDTTHFPFLITVLNRVLAEFERMFPGRSFPLDERLADALAESLAEVHYDLSGIPEATPGDPVPLLVKAAAGGKVYLHDCPAHLLVLRLYRDGSFEEVFNGPGAVVWEAMEPNARTGKGQWAVRLPVLRRAMDAVPPEDRVVPVRIK